MKDCVWAYERNPFKKTDMSTNVNGFVVINLMICIQIKQQLSHPPLFAK